MALVSGGAPSGPLAVAQVTEVFRPVAPVSETVNFAATLPFVGSVMVRSLIENIGVGGCTVVVVVVGPSPSHPLGHG